MREYKEKEKWKSIREREWIWENERKERLTYMYEIDNIKKREDGNKKMNDTDTDVRGIVRREKMPKDVQDEIRVRKKCL